MRRRLLVTLLVLACMPAGVTSATMLVQAYVETKHDRFYVGEDKAFIGDPYDWSGVGRGSRWATMVSSSYFLSATHYHPADDSTLYFYYSNDPDGGHETRTVASGVQIGGTDLWLGRLSEPVGSQVTIYPILSLLQLSDYDNRVLYAFGLSDKSPAQENVQLGRNNIDPDSYVLYSESPSQGMVYTFDYNTAGGLGADECYLISGDSGGPSFSIIDGVPALVGIHWSNDYTNPDTGLISSVDSFVPYYVAEINAAMSDEQLTLIPEPGAWAMLIAAALAGLLYARRSRTPRNTTP